MNPYNKIKTNKAQSFINEATGETSSATKEPKKVGRPKGSISMHKKESIINVYVTKEDKIKLKELAQKYRMPISQYLLFKAFSDVQ